MQHKSKLSQLSGSSGQQSRNRRPQLANPRMHCAAKSKSVLLELKQREATDSVTLKSQNNPLTDIKSIYAAFKVVITPCLLSERSNEDIFSLG